MGARAPACHVLVGCADRGRACTSFVETCMRCRARCHDGGPLLWANRVVLVAWSGVSRVSPSRTRRSDRGRMFLFVDVLVAAPTHAPHLRHTRGLQRTFQPVEPASLCDGHDETACAGSSSVTSRRDEGFSTTLLTSPMHSPPEAMNLLNPFVVDVCRAEEATVVDGRQLRRAVTAFTRIRLRGD